MQGRRKREKKKRGGKKKRKNWIYFKKLLGCIIFIIGFMTGVVIPLLFESIITLQGWSKFFVDLEWISMIVGIVLMAIGAFIFFKYGREIKKKKKIPLKKP